MNSSTQRSFPWMPLLVSSSDYSLVRIDVVKKSEREGSDLHHSVQSFSKSSLCESCAIQH